MFGFEIPAWAIGVGFIILAGSLAGGVKRLLSGDHGNPRPRGKLSRRDVGQMVGDLETRLGDVDELRGKLAALEDMQRRLGALEGRVDFAERRLATQRDADRRATPKSCTKQAH